MMNPIRRSLEISSTKLIFECFNPRMLAPNPQSNQREKRRQGYISLFPHEAKRSLSSIDLYAIPSFVVHFFSQLDRIESVREKASQEIPSTQYNFRSSLLFEAFSHLYTPNGLQLINSTTDGTPLHPLQLNFFARRDRRASLPCDNSTSFAHNYYSQRLRIIHATTGSRSEINQLGENNKHLLFVSFPLH